MKMLVVVLLLLTLLTPAVAFADAATDAALGLGAFAVFNQILGGVGIFGSHPAPVVVAPPVVTERVVVREYYPPPRPVYHYYYPAPVYYYTPAPVVVRERGWCPPGQARKGRC
jgi:hypothetical protein